MSLGAAQICEIDPTRFFDFVSARLGPSCAMALQKAFGGRRIAIPVAPQEHHVLCKAIGVSNVEVIAKEFGTGIVEVPIGPTGHYATRRSLIEAACIEGKSVNAIAREFQCTARTVQQMRAKLRAAGRMT